MRSIQPQFPHPACFPRHWSRLGLHKFWTSLSPQVSVVDHCAYLLRTTPSNSTYSETVETTQREFQSSWSGPCTTTQPPLKSPSTKSTNLTMRANLEALVSLFVSLFTSCCYSKSMCLTNIVIESCEQRWNSTLESQVIKEALLSEMKAAHDLGLRYNVPVVLGDQVGCWCSL